MIKQIVFDMGGVLIDFAPDRTLRSVFTEDDTALIRRVLFDSGLWANLDLGKMHLPELAEAACALLPARLHAPLTELVVNWWDHMPPIDGMEDLVRELKANGYGIYLLSNTSDDIYRYFDNYPVLSLMDGIIASFVYGVMKPDPRLYRALYEKYSLDPAECFFIDDMQKNIDGALQTGMAGYCFADRDLARLRDAMRGMRIRI